MEQVFYNIQNDCVKCCSMSEYFIDNQAKHASFIVSNFKMMM